MTERTHAPARPEKAGARPVSRRCDPHEREAERAADVVVRGGSVAGWSFSSIGSSASPPVQRQEVLVEKTEEEKKKQALEKTKEAALETPQAKALKEKVLADPLVKTVKDAVTSTPGLIVSGAALAGGVGALAATGKELPIQPPEIPLDKITPGLAGKVTYQGPVNAPTFVGISITFKEQGPKKKAGPSQIATDVARIKAQEQMFKPEGQKSAEKQQEQEMISAWIASQAGLTIPLTGTPKAEDAPKKEEETAKTPVQPAPASAAVEPAAEAHVDAALAGGGRPLEPGTRHAMESRFGRDFSNVRVHDDAHAAAAAAGIDAAAFTVGEDVAFGRGRYDASSAAGRRLLAHELAHVVQQAPRPARIQRKTEPAIGTPGDPAEREADDTAARVLAGEPVDGVGATTATAAIQRQGDEGELPADEDLEWPELDEGGPAVQAKRSSGPPAAPAGFAAALAAAGPGSPLPAAPRRALERSFGASFADVRLHRDGASHRLATAIGAEAFTAGAHVHLAAHAPDWATPAGLGLLAHELTHVRQQARGGGRGRVVQRSRALYFSTLGKQPYFKFAEPFHRDRGFPAPVRVSSIEELLEHLVALPRPIESVRLVTHAVEAGIMLPLLRGGQQSLFPADLALMTQTALESELVTEHQTNVKTGAVTEQSFHVVPQDWVAAAYARVAADKPGKEFLRTRRFPDAVTPGGDLESLIWWTLDRELVLAERERPAGKGKTKKQFVFPGIPAADRPKVAASLARNAAIYQERARDHLVLRGPKAGTLEERRARAAAAAAELVERLRSVAPALIDDRAPGERFGFGRPTQRYGTIQEALERGTFPNNVLFAKTAIPNGMPFEIRGCNIGKNPTWLGLFRDFWGLGAGPTRRRPDVSAPDLRHIFGRRKKKTAEWLQTPKGGVILGDTPAFDAHIQHAR